MRTAILLIVFLLGTLGNVHGQNSIITLAEQIEVPPGLPREVAWEALKARIRLHTLQHICQDLPGHISASIEQSDYPAMAAIAYSITVEEEARSDNTVTAHLTARQNETGELREAADSLELLELAGHLVARTELLLRTLDSLWPSGRLYTGDLTKVRPLVENKAGTDEPGRIAEKLRAYTLALDAMGRRNRSWLTDKHSLMAVEDAAAILDTDPYIHLLLAECRFLNHLPQQTVISASKALSLKWDMKRARYIRALAYRDLEQYALAENDLSVILDQPNGTRKYPKTYLPCLLARAEMRTHMAKYIGMCEDLHHACRLGDCEALKKAGREEICPY